MTRRQRDRLYEAEDNLIEACGSWYASVEGAQFDVDRMLATKWWKDRSPVTEVDVVYPVRGSGIIRVTDLHWRVEYSPRALNDVNLVHELTHVLIGVTPGEDVVSHDQDHSAHFAMMELELMKRMLGSEMARRLRAEFEKCGVVVADR